MTTDNRTNEQIVDEAMSVQWGRGGWFAGAVVTALEAAGRLVKPNETKSGQEFCFSDAQVKAAQRAWLDYPHKRGGLSNAEDAMRAALEAAARAAQGAAPQAESKCQTCSREASFCAHCVAEMELAPVLPSSGVDEGELEHRVEEVIRDVVDMPLSTRLVLARAVVEAIGGESRG